MEINDDVENTNFMVDETDNHTNDYKKEFVKKNRKYYSSSMGAYIVDAVTNTTYPWKVGSFDEKRFFRVIDTKNNTKLFFETPQVYTKYTGVVLDSELVECWYENRKVFDK